MESSGEPSGWPWAEMVLTAGWRDLAAGFRVRRVLPAARRRMVGPFIFLDQMGPQVLGIGQGLDVPPHPHIGLATVTCLFDGELLHRDSLGSVEMIRPGEVNWMTAGRGIVHSERTPSPLRLSGSPLFGLQAWVALPGRDEETEPEFAHYSADLLPVIDGEGVRVQLIAGALFGSRSPVVTRSDLFYAEVNLAVGARLSLPLEYEERALYVVAGRIATSASRNDEAEFEAGQLLVLKPGAELTISAASGRPARLMLLGGEPLDGPRYVWWNFVSSSKERIDQAREDWRAGRFPPVPGEEMVFSLPQP